MIPYGKQNISNQDVKQIIKVLNSNWLTQGPMVKKFEDRLTNYTKAKFSTVVNSATSALHIACLALGLKKHDFLWTVPNTFVSSANCALFCGANVDFVDIDPVTKNMSVQALNDKLIIAKKSNRLPKVVVPVAFGGQSCDLKAIKALSKKFKFKILEDASHGIGGFYQGHPIGSCVWSDITVFSFHPVKIITTGEGGAVMTNDPNLDSKLKLYRTHGITKNQKEFKNKVDGFWSYEMQELGLNYRMTDFSAALGLSQINRINNFVKKRTKIAERYHDSLRRTGIQLPKLLEGYKSSWHLYVINWDNKKFKRNRNDAINYLRKNKIGCTVHYIPVHYHPYYQKLGFKKDDYNNSKYHYETAISLPIYPDLSFQDQSLVIKKLKNLL